MHIRAEIITPGSSTPTQKTLSGVVAILNAAEASRISLQLRDSDIAEYHRQGNDLILMLGRDEEIVLLGFFNTFGGDHTALAILGAEGGYVPVSFSAEDTSGLLAASSSEAASSQAYTTAVADNSDFATLAMVSGVGAVALVALAASRDDKGEETPSERTIAPSTGDALSGTGHPGDVVEIDVDGDAIPDFSTTVVADGTWSIDIKPNLPVKTSVDVVFIDDEGNRSGPLNTVTEAPLRAESTDTGSAGAAWTGEINGEPDQTTMADPRGKAHSADAATRPGGTGDVDVEEDADTFTPAHGGIALDFTTVDRDMAADMAAVDSTGSGNNTLGLSIENVIERSSITSIPSVNGGADKDIASEGLSDADIPHDIHPGSGGVTLWIEQGIDITVI